MNTTISISIPVNVKRKALRAVGRGVFSTLDDLVLAGIHTVIPKSKRPLKHRLTMNGFTPEFEREVLEAEKEPLDQAIEWDGKGSSVEFALKHAK